MEIQIDEVFEAWHFKKYYVQDADKSMLYEKFENKDVYVSYEVNYAWEAWQASKVQVAEGFVLIKNNSKTIVAIEKMVEQQVEASGITWDVFRLDGEKILEAMIEAQGESHE